ncbi:unnamed protein product [Camellia sinensis]
MKREMEEVDLAEERSKAEFDVEAMKIVWAGSPQALEVSDRISKLVASDPVFRKDNRPMLSRKDLFKNTLRKAAYAWKRIIELRLSGIPSSQVFKEEAATLRFFVDEAAFTDLHWGHGTEEQQQKWLPLAYKMQIIGCYAQTELGHGSNVQGLETTATFDPQADEFIIHSPTLTSSKWWPGGLGKVSTHAVVYAHLITDGQDHGVHGFIVQLRSLEDHSPLPGITVGDIGMKFGNGAYNSMDNGVLRFDHVHIPRDQMLMRVTREGKYMQSNIPRQLVYGTKVYVRQTIVADASCALSRAICIATRYSAVRRQFGSQNGGPETQVIDYKTQQSRLFPLLASAYAFRFVGEWLKWLYMDVTQKLQANDFSTLLEAHACTAGLKSLTTSATVACTYEGANIVLLLQVARFLMKTVSQLGFGMKPVGTTSYMGRVEHLMQCRCDVQRESCSLVDSEEFEPEALVDSGVAHRQDNSEVKTGLEETHRGWFNSDVDSIAKDWAKPRAVLEAFGARAVRMSVACAQNLSKFANSEEELSADLVEVAAAHCQLIVVSRFIEKLQQVIPGKGIKQQLEMLCNVYALFLLHKHQGDFLSTGCITAKLASLANDQLRSLYSQ